MVEAAAELGPVSGEHEISLDVHPATVSRARATSCTASTINLIENALRHTPPGTEIRVIDRSLARTAARSWSSRTTAPACPRELAPTLFERFVRGAGDRGGSFGLGLAIVRAVAESHGGTVTLELDRRARRRAHGARFVVRLPARPRASNLDDDRQHHRPPLEAVVD